MHLEALYELVIEAHSHTNTLIPGTCLDISDVWLCPKYITIVVYCDSDSCLLLPISPFWLALSLNIIVSFIYIMILKYFNKKLLQITSIRVSSTQR
jgi:hypothetical protein